MKVKNRSASVVVYKIPESNINRRFMPSEIKEISEEELKQLLFQPGGAEILRNYLQVAVEDVKKLNMEEPEREYFYTEEQIKNIILNGSQDEFLDMLDFAPDGVLNLVKAYAVSLPMADLYKIKALRDKIGFDVTKALENIADSDDKEVSQGPKRRVQTSTTANKYKVISDN